MRDVVDARELDADEDGARNRRFGFHDAARRLRRGPRSSELVIAVPTAAEERAERESGATAAPYVLPMSDIGPQ